MIDPPIPQPPRSLGPHQDRDGPAYDAASPPLAGLVSRMILQGWTQHEAHYAMLTFAVRRIARTAREMGTPEAMDALLDLPEQVREQIDFQMAASNGSLPVIPGWQ